MAHSFEVEQSSLDMIWNLLNALDLVAILMFAGSYYVSCYRRGYTVDIWHLIVFQLCVFPNLFLLPIARNDLNGIVLGPDLRAVQTALPAVFAITLVGYLSILIGGGLWRLRTGLGLRKALVPILDFPSRCSMMMMSSRGLLVFQSSLCLLMQGVILAVYFAHSGFGFDVRSYTFANPSLRPVALLASNYSVTIASHCFARYLDTKERILLTCTLLLMGGLLFFGARSSLLSIFFAVAICYFVKLRKRISLLKIGGGALLAIFLAMYLGAVRSGQYSFSEFLGGALFLLLFGNNFSDLRDFAWVYSAWNHTFWAGKTYLAAFAAFIPRFASEFRDTWGLGVATASTVGFDPAVHPGLRPGIFGEGFFNFGLPGVVAVGLLLGIVIRHVDIDVKRAFASPQPSMMKAFASTVQLGVVGNFALSSGFSSLYVLCGIWLFSWFCLGVMRLVNPRRAIPPARAYRASAIADA